MGKGEGAKSRAAAGKAEGQSWFGAEGEEDGKPIIFRGRQGVPSGVVESEYPNLISIFWPYEPENDSGMPDDETVEAQVEFEDALDGLDAPGVGFLMLVVLGNGRKEWHWYVSDVEAWLEGLNDLLAGRPLFPVRIERRYEPVWASYHDFVAGVEGL